MKTILVTGAIIQTDSNFLIGRRGKDEKSAGMWEFPGGKLEEGESPKECIKRELKEELNIDAEIGELFFSYTYNYPPISYELYFFKVNSFFGEPVKSVHDKLKWEKLKNFYKYDFLPGDGPLIDKLISENNKR
tara:strand:- start:114 stop:512 length:399 start_codon:yes stop_codon:yes gene_type:complete